VHHHSLMKQCRVCQRALPHWEFAIRHKKTGKRHGYCYECQREYCREYYRRNRALYNERRYQYQRKNRHENRMRVALHLQEHPCVDCGERDIRVLEFDHVRGTKLANISEMIGACIAWQRIEAELAKCEVRCANCHRRRTNRQFAWFRERVGV
jgi:hypothetical protein